jgi:hypothetical protein
MYNKADIQRKFYDKGELEKLKERISDGGILLLSLIALEYPTQTIIEIFNLLRTLKMCGDIENTNLASILTGWNSKFSITLGDSLIMDALYEIIKEEE